MVTLVIFHKQALCTSIITRWKHSVRVLVSKRIFRTEKYDFFVICCLSPMMKKKYQMRIQRRVIFNGLMVGLIERHACLQRWQAASKMDLERHDGELLTFVVFYSESEKLMTADGDPECVRKWNWLNLDRQY